MKHPTSSSRRRFLATAAAALAAPAIIPSRLLGRNAPSKKVHLACIGVGNRGASMLRHDILPLDDVRVLAVADCYQSRREQAAALANEKYGAGVCRPYADFREILARDDIDGVVIATTDHWHVPIAILAARAGKDIYVEKPLSVAMAWAWKLRVELAKRNLIFQYGTQQRSARQFRMACELVRNGYIGEIQRVEAWCPDMSTQFEAFQKPPYGSTDTAEIPADLDFDRWLGPAPQKPYTIDRCTCYGSYHIQDHSLGFIAGWGAHPLDIVQWGLGTDHTGPVQYHATGKLPPAGSLADTVESWDVLCQYANGIALRFMGSRVAKPIVQKYHYVFHDHGTTFFGSEGWISVDRAALFSHDRNRLREVRLKDSDTRLYESAGHMRNFVDCIRSRNPTVCPFESALRSDTICHLADIAIRSGRPIQWDPAGEKILGDVEAAAHLDRPMRAKWAI